MLLTWDPGNMMTGVGACDASFLLSCSLMFPASSVTFKKRKGKALNISLYVLMIITATNNILKLFQSQGRNLDDRESNVFIKLYSLDLVRARFCYYSSTHGHTHTAVSHKQPLADCGMSSCFDCQGLIWATKLKIRPRFDKNGTMEDQTCFHSSTNTNQLLTYFFLTKYKLLLQYL